METDPSVHISLGNVLTAAMTGLAGIAVWILQKLGMRHIQSIDNLATKIELLRGDLNELKGRVAIVEFAQKHYHPNERERDKEIS